MKPTSDLVPISPESLEIVQVYLSTQSIPETAHRLGIAEFQVSQYLRKPEVKNYIDHIYLTAGYRNRDKIARTLDDLIDQKLSEMIETGLGSNKDIADLLTLAHKMRTDEMKLMIDHEKAKEIKKQTNVQINDTSGSNYSELLGKLLC
jgi:predicted transcriptional regulator